MPNGKSFFSTGIGYSVTLPVFGSNLPMNCSPKSEYQVAPSASTRTSWGIASFLGRSYSVTIVRVALPCGRGKVLSGKLCFEL